MGMASLAARIRSKISRACSCWPDHSSANFPERISSSTSLIFSRIGASSARKRAPRVILPYWLVCEWKSICFIMPTSRIFSSE